ncbi:MAG: insulinase family protein [Planctomycetaceae bacterium]|nr:MAG: insulinase family protein [Planctomycetaceae bacterium]
MPEQQIHTHVFPNGLTLLVEPMADVQSAAFSLLTPCGSNYDPVGQEGAASVLCEWIMRGAGALGSMELTTALDNLGLQRNEGVGNTHMSFSGATIADSLPAALRLYADIVRRPHLPEEEFDASKLGVEQSLRALEDEPRQKVMNELRKRSFAAPWGTPSEGTLEGVTRLTPAVVRELFERCTQPRQTILGIAGRVDPVQMRELTEELFGDWIDRPIEPWVDGLRGPTRDHVMQESAQTQIGIAYPSVPYRDVDYYAAWGVVNVLSGGMSSRLFTEVRERRGLCYSVYATLHSLRDQAQVLCYAGTTAERAQETLDVTLRELRRVSEGIGEDELRRCKARAKSSLIMQQESSASRASSLARDWYHLGRVTTLDEVRDKIEALTVRALLEHARRYPARDLTVLTLGPAPLEVSLAVL